MNNLSILQPINFDGVQVSFSDTAYLNATAIAQHFGKRVGNYLQNERTTDYINAVSDYFAETGNPVTAKNQLVIIKKGGNDKNAQGTWLHPKLAIDFARWLNPKFAVWCDIQISKILNLDENARPRTKTTTTDRKPLVQAVNMLCVKSGLHQKEVWTMVHQYMGVDSIEDITLQDIPKAVEYVHRLMLPDSLAQTQSYLKQEDAFVISKALCYALRYTEMAEKLIQQPKDNKNTIQYYFCNLCDINQGMFVVFSPNYQQDVHEAITLLREIAQHSLPLS